MKLPVYKYYLCIYIYIYSVLFGLYNKLYEMHGAYI